MSRLGSVNSSTFGGSISDNFTQSSTLFQPTSTISSTSPELSQRYSFLSVPTLSYQELFKNSQLISAEEARAMDNDPSYFDNIPSGQQQGGQDAPPQRDNNKTLIGIALILALGAGAYFVLKN